MQAAAVAFGESLPIPEIVAIGGQVLPPLSGDLHFDTSSYAVVLMAVLEVAVGWQVQSSRGKVTAEVLASLKVDYVVQNLNGCSVQAFLGFRFNIKEVEMGTRR